MTTLALVLALTAAADATPEDAAKRSKELFATAQKLYKQGKFVESIAKLEEAYAAKPYAVIFFNIAKCHEQLGDVPKALRAYRDYLRLAPDAKEKQEVSDSIANLERRLKDKGLQQVIVFAEPADAHIEVDGKDLGASPASTELTAGSHKLVVTAKGLETVERSFNVAAGRSSELTVTLQPASSATASTGGTGSTGSTGTTSSEPSKAEPTKSEPASTSSTTTATASSSAPRRGRLFTWVAAGVGVVGLGAGIGLGVTAQGAASKLTSGMAMDHAMADAWRSQAQGLSLGANISYAVAGVALAAAVVLFFLEK